MSTPAPITPPAPAPTTAPTATVKGADLNSDLPPVNENAIRAASLDAAAETPAPARTADLSPDQRARTSTPPDLGRDILNRPFDSAKFRPEKDRTGRWKNLHGGRKPGLITAPKNTATGSTVPATFPGAAPKPPAPPAGPASPGAAPAAPATDYDATAEAYLVAFYVATDSALDAKGEWYPDDAAEHAPLKTTLAAYLRSRNAAPVAPIYAFAASAIGYVWRRLRRVNTGKALVRYAPTLAAWLGFKVEKPADTTPTAGTPAKPGAAPVEAPSTPPAPTATAPRDPFTAACLPRP